MQINPLLPLSKVQTKQAETKVTEEQQKPIEQNSSNFQLRSKFNDHLLSFKARVDKGLERFYETNEERMPITVRRYVDALEDKSRLTPLEAQQRAFDKLETAQSVEDIKKHFADEPLFAELKNPEDTKATRGILNSIKENKELIELYDKGILKDKKNLTVYLVQKVFLEGKTIDEINKDLENDLDEDFKADFKFKNNDSKYVYSSTLKALGIKTPPFEYQQSLRYTREGYSDEVGEKISQGQRAFWDSLSESERTARAKKSVEQFENWWNSLTKNQKLDMIADQLNAIDMLKEFKKAERAENKKNPPKAKETEAEKNDEQKGKHTKVGSHKLSKDELFIKWATNNLKMFEANLSEAEKDTLHLKRMQRLVSRWAQMSPAEKTDYISKMKSGSEPLRYAMIDAWNHSTDLIKDLSIHLKESQIFKPADLLYSTQQFSEFQSRVMTAFWNEHPEYAESLGNKIQESHSKIQTSIQRGTFEELKKQIMRDKNQRIKELEKFKAQNLPQIETPKNQDTKAPNYISEFKQAYLKEMSPRLHNIPDAYMNEYFQSIESLPKEQVISWTKNLKGELLDKEDEINLGKLMQAESELSAFEQNRALEAAIAPVLYQHTHDPEVFTLSFSDVKTAIYKLEIGENPIQFYSTRLGKNFSLPVVEKVKINKAAIENTYRTLRQPLDDTTIDDIIHYYYHTEKSLYVSQEKLQETKEHLKDYIKKFNKSALIIFSDKSAFSPQIKDAFYRKFISGLPREIMEGPLKPSIKSLEDFKYEEKLKTARYMYGKKLDFIPEKFMDSYFSELAKQIREGKNQINIDQFIELSCRKRKTSYDHGKVLFFDKLNMTVENKIKALAMEQALADILYEATGNEEVYSMGLESLCDNLEVLALAKKFPTGEKYCPATQENDAITLVAKKKPNLAKVNMLYKEYQDQITDWTKEIAEGKITADWEDLLYILNPEENNPQKDLLIAQRMGRYGISPRKISYHPNGFLPY